MGDNVSGIIFGMMRSAALFQVQRVLAVSWILFYAVPLFFIAVSLGLLNDGSPFCFRTETRDIWRSIQDAWCYGEF
jgi:hypothetical protein